MSSRGECFLYARVSSETQELEHQIYGAQQFVELYPGMKITRTFQESSSAWSAIPQQMIFMIKTIEELPVEDRPYILVKNVDRFSRNISYGSEIINKIISLGVTIIFYQTPSLNVRDPNGRMEFDRLLGIAQGASDHTSAQVRFSIQARKNQGLLTTAKPVFGEEAYDCEDPTDGVVKTYVRVNPDEYMVQALISLFYGDYTPDQLMQSINVYKNTFGNPNCEKTLYDDFVDISEKDNIFYSNVSTFAKILNYFEIYKRDSNWTGSSVGYQWNKYIENNLLEFQLYNEVVFGLPVQ